jgi:hypothetical protein
VVVVVDRMLGIATTADELSALPIRLPAWIQLGARLIVFAAVLDVVLTRRRWPRSLRRRGAHPAADAMHRRFLPMGRAPPAAGGATAAQPSALGAPRWPTRLSMHPWAD